MGRDSSVGIATRYGLDGPGIESRWGARFSAPVQTGPGSYPASCTMGTGSFSGVKRPGRGADHPPPFKCRGHERVGLYLCSPSVPSWPVLGWTFTYLTLFAIKCQLRYFLYAVCLLVRDYTEVKSELRTEADTKPRSDVLSQILCFENLLFAYFTRRIVPLNPCIVYPTGNFEQLQFS